VGTLSRGGHPVGTTTYPVGTTIYPADDMWTLSRGIHPVDNTTYPVDTTTYPVGNNVIPWIYYPVGDIPWVPPHIPWVTLIFRGYIIPWGISRGYHHISRG
jgi:hypothetical protein